MSYIGGKWRDDAPGGRLTSTNPATGEPAGEALLGDAAQFVEACSVARDAQRGWAATPAPVRGRVIERIGRLVEANAEALARLVTREIGKPLAEAAGRGAGGRRHLHVLRR